MSDTFTLLAVATLAACLPPADSPPAGGTAANEAFELRMGEETQAGDDLTVRFAAVIGDSRCPSDVTCIWEGDAEIEVVVARGEDRRSLELHTHGGEAYPSPAAAFGCTLELQQLDPYPVSTEEIAPEDYVATLQVKIGGTPENAI